MGSRQYTFVVLAAFRMLAVICGHNDQRDRERCVRTASCCLPCRALSHNVIVRNAGQVSTIRRQMSGNADCLPPPCAAFSYSQSTAIHQVRTCRIPHQRVAWHAKLPPPLGSLLRSPDEHPFTPISKLPPPLIAVQSYPPLLHPQSTQHPSTNVNNRILKFYVEEIVPAITKRVVLSGKAKEERDE
jgi:hypothetical protein